MAMSYRASRSDLTKEPRFGPWQLVIGCLLISSMLPTLVSAGGQRQDSSPRHWDVGTFLVSLTGQVGTGDAEIRFSFEVTAKKSGAKTRFLLSNFTREVADVFAYGAKRLIVVGRSGVSHAVTLVEPSSGKIVDSFLAYDPQVSPTGQYIAFERFIQRHAPPTDDVVTDLRPRAIT